MPVLTRPGYADLIRNTPGLVGYWRMRDVTATVYRNELTTADATMAGFISPAQGTPIADGVGRKFNGTSQALKAAIDLSAYSQASVSFWLWWDSWTTGNHYAMEYCNVFNGFNNADQKGGFVFSAGATTVTIGIGHMISAVAKYWLDTFPVPTAAAWHHYLLTFDRATPVSKVYVDGVAQTLTLSTHDAVSFGAFSNDSLSLMSRNASTFWGAGRISDVALYGGVLLTANDARNHYQAGVGW